MGALGPVFVEQLTAKNSIEEVMNEINKAKRTSRTRLDATSDSNEKYTTLHRLLKRAKFIRPPLEAMMKKRKVMEPFADAVGTITEQQHANLINSTLSAKPGRVRFKDIT
jgi:hypothetical protein